MLYARLPVTSHPLAALVRTRTLVQAAALAHVARASSEPLHSHFVPRNVGVFKKSAAGVGTALVGKASRGRILKLQVRVEDGIIADAKFKTLGCGDAPSSLASATESIKGSSVDEVLGDAQGGTDVAKVAIRAAIADYKAKHEVYLGHFRNPCNVGSLGVDADVGTALVGKASRGGVVRMQLRIRDGIISDAKFKAVGCDSTLACGSFATESIKGRPLEEALRLEGADIATHLRLTPGKIHSSVLVVEAIRTAIADYEANHEVALDHISNPRNMGSFATDAVNIGTALVGKASRGGVVRMQVRVEDGIIGDARFTSVGCDSTLASASFATERIKGRPLEEAQRLDGADIASHLRLPSTQAHTSALVGEAIRAAIADYEAKHELALDHISNPRNMGSFATDAVDIGTALVGKASRGSVVRMQVRVQDGLISDVRFTAIGCGSTLASASYAAERIKGRPLAEAQRLEGADIAACLGLPCTKAHTSALAGEAIQAAIADYISKRDACSISYSQEAIDAGTAIGKARQGALITKRAKVREGVGRDTKIKLCTKSGSSYVAEGATVSSSRQAESLRPTGMHPDMMHPPVETHSPLEDMTIQAAIADDRWRAKRAFSR